MTITETSQALGAWDLALSGAPRSITDQLDYFGHLVVLPGRIAPALFGDSLLAVARYVGVLRERDRKADRLTLRGSGMAFWLGDEDEKGSVFETAVNVVDQTFANTIRALLPASGAVTEGVLHNVPGLFSNSFQWQTPRTAIGYVTDTYSSDAAPVGWRVNGDGSLDAGLLSDLYVTTPQAMITRKDEGRSLLLRSLPGSMELDTQTVDYTTRIVLLGEGDGNSIATGAADAAVVPYKDIHGNVAVFTRMVSESSTHAPLVGPRAQLQLNRFSAPKNSVQLSSTAYDVTGAVDVGDYVYVWDPDNGFTDPTVQVNWRGQPIHPIALRLIETTWPVPAGWTVAYRTKDGTWLDLSSWYVPQDGDTQLVVGSYASSIVNAGLEPVGARPFTGDSSVPGVPVFGTFSSGSYQSSTGASRAAIQATWSTPLNVDGSTISDGDHYEIRYRTGEYLGFGVRWGTMTGTRWGQESGFRWGAPTLDAIDANRQWLTVFVAWGTNDATILELTPGAEYEFQIRAVDSANPPNRGDWSPSSFVTAAVDQQPPSTPAAPTVAGSRIAVQVVHTLGKASGGTFNLEADLDHLNVHLGGSADFNPDESNLIGRMTANAAMIAATVPAVGTFTIEPVDQVHIKVVAVDTTGNMSGASADATVTAELVDDAHISSLTVSKVTAGQITAEWILAGGLQAGTIKTASSGQRIQIDNSGVYGYADDTTTVISMVDAEPDTGFPSFNVYAPDGTPRIRIGQVDDETYDLVAYDDTGDSVALAQLAFGQASADVSAGESTTSSSATDLATFGPQVSTVVGASGRCWVTLSAFINWNNNGLNGGEMLFEAAGPTTVVPFSGRSLRMTASSTGGVNLEASRRLLLQGLTPGVYTFTAKYRKAADDGTNTAVTFANRNISVEPF